MIRLARTISLPISVNPYYVSTWGILRRRHLGHQQGRPQLLPTRLLSDRIPIRSRVSPYRRI